METKQQPFRSAAKTPIFIAGNKNPMLKKIK